MNEELKPCPFCGSTEIRYGYGTLFPVVWCFKCDSQVEDVDEVDNAIELWNTRPIEDALQARIAELEWNNSELTDENKELNQRVTEMEERLRWIPVEESVPEKGKLVIAYTNKGSYVFLEMIESDKAFIMYPYPKKDYESGATHWMPLPESPIVYGKVCEE